MHKEILNDKQLELLPIMAGFRREYYLVGGTAIALYLGHRRSIDFDMFKASAINHKKNLDKLTAAGFHSTITRRVEDFLLKEHFSIEEISECANNLFGDLYSEKMFRAQLCYFEDVDYTEEVDYLLTIPPSNDEIKDSLVELVQKGI